MFSWFRQAEVLINKNTEDFGPLETELPYHVPKEDIPTEANEFYNWFGKIRHQETGKIIEKLAPYQIDLWNCKAKTTYCVKMQKAGITSSEMLHDFQECIIPGIGRGKDVLLIAQTKSVASQHLYQLKRAIMDSPTCRKYMITKSSELFFREEQTKQSMIFIKNPDNPYRPSRIIGVGFDPGQVWSWENIFRVHISDPAVAKTLSDKEVFSAAQSRLANTNGRTMIEGPPNGPIGKFYDYYEQYKDNLDPDFQVFTVIDEDGIKAGVVTREYLNRMKKEMGPEYAAKFQASFVAGVGNVFTEDEVNDALDLGEKLKHLKINPYAKHSGGIDWGFGGDKEGNQYKGGLTTIYIGEQERYQGRNIMRLVFWEEIEHGVPSKIASKVDRLRRRFPNIRFMVDGSNRGAVNELKDKLGEDTDWEDDIQYEDVIIIPVPFGSEHEDMLFTMWKFTTDRRLAIPKECKELERSMRTARANKFDLDKKQTAKSDHLDAVRLLLYPFMERKP